METLLTAPLGSGIHQEPHHYYGGFTPYVAGVDAPEYVIKPMGYSWGSSLQYLPFYRASRRVFADANLSYFDRIKLETLLEFVVIRFFWLMKGGLFLRESGVFDLNVIHVK